MNRKERSDQGGKKRGGSRVEAAGNRARGGAKDRGGHEAGVVYRSGGETGAGRVELIFAQFGSHAGKLEPSLGSFLSFFPSAGVVLYTDEPLSFPGIEVRTVIPPFPAGSRRYGHHCNDFYKVTGLLESSAAVAVALDRDMIVVSPEVRALIPMTLKFGLCLPANPRGLVKVDNTVGCDSDGRLDESLGCGYSPNMSPMACRPGDRRARRLLGACAALLKSQPVRGPVAMWRACWKTGIFPCLLPPQWCVCGGQCGMGNEIILHGGHQKVLDYYRDHISGQAPPGEKGGGLS